MPSNRPVAIYLKATNDQYQFGGRGSGATLWGVDVGTAVASAVITLYHGTTTSDPVIATIDGNVVCSHNFWGAWFGNGVLVVMTAANGKVTVTAG